MIMSFFLQSYLSPLSFILLGREPSGDRILRPCLQKAPATARSNYGPHLGGKHRLLQEMLVLEEIDRKLPLIRDEKTWAIAKIIFLINTSRAHIQN